MAGLLAVLVDGGSQLGKAGEVGLGVGFGVDGMLSVEEVRQVVEGRSAHLIEDVGIARSAAGVFELLGRGDLLAQGVEDDVAVELVGRRQGAGVERLQPGELGLGERLVLRHGGEGAVRQLGLLVRSGPEIETDGGRGLRLHVETFLDEGCEQLIELGVRPWRGERGGRHGGKRGRGCAGPEELTTIHADGPWMTTCLH